MALIQNYIIFPQKRKIFFIGLFSILKFLLISDLILLEIRKQAAKLSRDTFNNKLQQYTLQNYVLPL